MQQRFIPPGHTCAPQIMPELVPPPVLLELELALLLALVLDAEELTEEPVVPIPPVPPLPVELAELFAIPPIPPALSGMPPLPPLAELFLFVPVISRPHPGITIALPKAIHIKPKMTQAASRFMRFSHG